MAEEEKSFKFDSENNVYKKNVIIHEIIFKKILEPPVWLDGLESPFKWGLHLRGSELVRWNIPGKLCDYDNQGSFYGFERLAFLMAMLFMKTCNNEMFGEESGSEESEDENDSQVEEKADEYDPEKCYAKCRETLLEMALNEGDIMYNRIGPALEHVLQTTRAHMLFLNGNHAESQELARNIQLKEDMSQKCLAGFEGLRAKVVMSMYQNYTITLPYLDKAMELDPNFGYWPYLTGKVLRRARREFDEGSIEEELEFFETAVSLERNPKFLVFLGQAYQEKAVSLFHSRGPTGELGSPDHLYQTAVELYSECWRLKNDSAAISRRVGNGMSKMRPEFIDKTVAKEALLKAIELSPNECTHISLGKFYYVHEMNDEKALEHFEQFHPSDFGTSEIIRLNLIKDPNYDPYDVLQSWLEVEQNAVKQYRAFCDAAWYYVVYRRDLEAAAKCLWKVLVKDHKSIRAKRALEYRSYAFCVEGPVNLVEVLVNEILLFKKKNERLPPEDRKDMKLLEDYLQKLFEKYPDLRNINPRPNLVEDLKRGVERFTGSRRRRRYGSVNRRSEPSRGLEEPVSWRSSRPNDGPQEGNEQQPHRQQQGDGNRRYNQRQSFTDSRSDMRNSFGGRDDESRNRGYNRDDRRRNSESQSNWSNARSSDAREGTSDQNEGNDRFRGRNDRQYNNRYDVTITDWRSENRRQ